jgi:exodeoxyribonuclease V gamma subunit
VLYVHRSPSAAVLADALAEILVVPPADPFAPEVVSVPTRGMERWLTQRLARRLGASANRRDGVCANIEFPFPGRLVTTALASACGLDPVADPWTAERLVWPLLGVVEECLDDRWLAPFADHLRRGGSERRFAGVRRIALLYSQYDLRGPDLLLNWARGEDTDAEGRRLPESIAWQAELWRRLRSAIGTPSLAERLDEACERLRSAPELAALPRRLALFGLTRLLPSHLRVLDALAAGRDLHLFVLHPSPALWDRVRTATAGGPPIRIRALDPTAALARNRLLASWGHDSRELQLVISGAVPENRERAHPLTQAAGPDTLLAALQADVRADRRPPGEPPSGGADERLRLGPEDLSVQVHACHGRARQVQVVRESILHALSEDATLEPRDVIVMCPDIETFAPLITATFGVGEPPEPEIADGPHTATHIGPTLRVRLADRALRSTNPLLAVLAQLLELASSRLTASQLLDLADTEPVRRRFAFDDDELAQIRDWVIAAEIHWGLDDAHRTPYHLGHLAYGTWEAGLRRILLGVALGASDWALYEGVLPVTDIDSGSIDLAGRLAELIDRLSVALDSLREPHTLGQWAVAIDGVVDALTATGDRDAWQRGELARLLGDVVAEAAGAAASATLALADVRALLAERLAGRPTRANFRTGELTVCTLVPMRSVPHRVICLLGLDDGAFPRRSPRDGDDLLLDDPRLGDRDPRTEDRQLLLDALLAARDQLIITYTGNDEHTNATLPPSVVVGELLDAIDETARADGGSARELVVVRHPLQPFDPANFVDARLRPGRPWSFDDVSLEGARALRGLRADRRPFLDGQLPDVDLMTVSLEDLVSFVGHPVRAFLRQRLGISLRELQDDVRDELPVALDALGRWGVGQRLLDGLLAGIDARTVALAELARGTLPPGELGKPVISGVWPVVELIAGSARPQHRDLPARSVETNVALPGGALLTGTVSGVHGVTLLTASFSRLSPRHRLAAWVRLLALSAAHPEEPYEAVTIGRAPSEDDAEVSVARLPMLAAEQRGRRERALALLSVLVDLRARGLREPLPLPCLAAAAYAQALWQGASEDRALDAAESAWRAERQRAGENAEPEHELAFGADLPFTELLALAPLPDERGAGWAEQASSRFGRCARRLWDPVLAHERTEQA